VLYCRAAPAEARSLGARPARRTPPVRAEAVHDRPAGGAGAPCGGAHHTGAVRPQQTRHVAAPALPAYPAASSQYSSGRPRMRALAR